MKKLILSTFGLLCIGVVYGQLLPNQKSELAINQEKNLISSAGIRDINQHGSLKRINNENIQYSVKASVRADFDGIINQAFDLMRYRVDLTPLAAYPIHFYFVTGIPESTSVQSSSIPWAYGFYEDLINSGVVSYTRLNPYNFDQIDPRIVIRVPKRNLDQEVLIGNILKGIGRILNEVLIGADNYWSSAHQNRDSNVAAAVKWGNLSNYAASSPRTFISEYFAIWVTREEINKVPDQSNRQLLSGQYMRFNGPPIG